MRSFLSTMILSMFVFAFGATAAPMQSEKMPMQSMPMQSMQMPMKPAVPLKPVSNLGAKCFARLEMKIDQNDNVFGFFQNIGPSENCSDMKLMPYQYVAFEVYGLDYQGASDFYAAFYAPKAPVAISDMIKYLADNKVICHHRADSVYWPYIAYYGCVAAEKAPVQ